jgi:predicted membrane channel-forming protein YqfA (hemolysin III family)
MRARRMAKPPSPSGRKLAGVALILLLILVWATFVASLAQVVGRWPVLVQAPFYLVMGIAWIIPLKPLIRWMQTGSIRVSRAPRD